ncbi:hypothetical protein LTR04_004839, partial [Oleoguttula sp. CCFEE 6159]
PFVYDAQTSIDPALLELDNFIIADPQTSGVAIDDAIVDAYDPTYSMHDASTPPELLTEPLDFLRFFSRYNVLHIQEWDEAVHGVVSGSRDKPTQDCDRDATRHPFCGLPVYIGRGTPSTSSKNRGPNQAASV